MCGEEGTKVQRRDPVDTDLARMGRRGWRLSPAPVVESEDGVYECGTGPL